MQRSDVPFPVARRSFLSKLGAGLATVGAAVGIDTAAMRAEAPADGWGGMPRTTGSVRLHRLTDSPTYAWSYALFVPLTHRGEPPADRFASRVAPGRNRPAR